MVRYNSFASAGRPAWGRFSGFYVYRRQLAYAGVGLSLFYLANLEKAPVSGRYRFMIVPQWLEMKLGDQSYRSVLREFRGSLLPEFSPETRRVKEVMSRISQVSGLPQDFDWKIHVVGGNFPPNAFVLPGGKVFVFKSMLPLCKDEDGLATVLSHETAHQVCRHSAEKMSQAPFRFLGMLALYAITGYSRFDDMIMQIAFELPSSRSMEREADYVGLMMMARACYNPANATHLWERMVRMERQEGQKVPELISTHPASERRIKDIQSHVPEAEQLRQDTCHQADNFWNSGLW